MTPAPEVLDRELARIGSRGHRAVVAGVLEGNERLCRGWSAHGPAPDGASVFEIGSITKVFTGVLLADMTLRGEVSLDDRLSRYRPCPNPAWRHREPTLLDLATHRSGLPNTPRPMHRGELAFALGLSHRDPWSALTEADYCRLVQGESPRRRSGGRVGYSSMGVGLLGDALAARVGVPYEQLLTQRILAPLGMASTGVTVPPELAHRLLDGYSRGGRPRPPLEDFMPAAGSLRSSTEDMLRFLAACLHPPSDPLGAALRCAQQPHARISKRVQIGLCWIILTRPHHSTVVWHNGGTWGFRSFAGFAPDQGAAAVVMANTARSVDRLGASLIHGVPEPAKRKGLPTARFGGRPGA